MPACIYVYLYHRRKKNENVLKPTRSAVYGLFASADGPDTVKVYEIITGTTRVINVIPVTVSGIAVMATLRHARARAYSNFEY